MEKLKPCPFCGGSAELHHEIGMTTQYSFCSCDNCGAKSEMIRMSLQYCADEIAAAAWNRRQNDERE